MPTLFRRRYDRRLEEVTRTEKVLGVFLLLLLGGIVLVYVVQVTTHKDDLFHVDEGALRGDEEPREAAVARQFLPALKEWPWPAVPADWRESGSAEAIPAEELSETLGEDAPDFVAFAAQWIYRRRYETTDTPRRTLTIMVCDVETPARALGLWYARKPQAAESLDVGRGGWLAHEDRSAGFFSGRYYTELHKSPDLSSHTITLPVAARAIASYQLSYGGPFEAEAMVPPKGCAVGSVPTGWKAGPTGAHGAQPTSGVAADRREDAATADGFPDPGVAGWHRPRRVTRFTPDTLYRKINGRADAYLQFHVAALTFGTYFHQSDPHRTIDVYWYDMGEPVNALGVYRSEAPHEVTPVGLGREGYQSFGAVFFCKGSSYVQVLPAKEDEADARVALEIAGRIEVGIDD